MDLSTYNIIQQTNSFEGSTEWR